MKRFVLAAITASFVLGLPFGSAEADAQISVPFFFPPIADCGTVATVESFFDLDGDGQLDECKVWIADSGGAFLVDGIDAFADGTRLFVEGLNCNTCLTTCPAGAILSATVTEGCPPKKGGGGGKKN